MQLHERLRIAMGVNCVKARELARRAAVDEGYVSRILRGKQTAPPATMARLILATFSESLIDERPEKLAA